MFTLGYWQFLVSISLISHSIKHIRLELSEDNTTFRHPKMVNQTRKWVQYFFQTFQRSNKNEQIIWLAKKVEVQSNTIDPNSSSVILLI